MSPSCTNIPTPIASPASVSRLAGTSKTYRRSAVPATETDAESITRPVPRQSRKRASRTTSTSPKAIEPRMSRSRNCLASSTESSYTTCSLTAVGRRRSMSSSACFTAPAVLMASAPARRDTPMAMAGCPLMRKKKPRASSSGRTEASDPNANGSPPRPRIGRLARSSTACGWSRSTTGRSVLPRCSFPSACTTRAPVRASPNACGEIPSWRSSAGSYVTETPGSVPPCTLMLPTPGTALSRGSTCSSAIFCSVPAV
jgi:hypothetical protein